MATSYFPWASEDDGTMRRKVQFDNGQVGEDTAIGNGTVHRQIGKNFAVLQGADAAPLLPKPALASSAVSPTVATKPSLPSEPVSPVSAPIPVTAVGEIPVTAPLTPSGQRQFDRVERRSGTRAANAALAGRFDARPIPAWANTDNLNTRDSVSPIGSTEPGVEKLWGRAKDGTLRFAGSKRGYEIKGRNPGDLATNFRRKLRDVKASGDTTGFQELSRFQAFLLNG